MEFQKDRIVFVPKTISTKDELLDLLCLELDFPSYFGFNWDALVDCLSDFSWLPVKKITIYHEIGFKLKDDEYIIYKDVLQIAADRLSQGEYPQLEFYFDRNLDEIV